MNSLVGSVLSDKYEVLEVVGTGGMAVVYKGKDLRLGRNVAIKVLKSEYNKDKEFNDRFQTESMAIASLSHPNIVNVYDVGFEDDLNYIVMELVSGRTLKEYLESLPVFMKEEAVINIGIQVGSALSQAHNKGVVHRDIKPHNILIDNDGRVKVADFGIARANTDETIVKSTKVFGSVHYASPEQARGDNVDKRSDIYSFGILLYELITKKLPFEADTPVAVAMMQINNEMPDPRLINPKITEGIMSIIDIATRKRREDRYQTAYEMVAELRRLKLDNEFVSVRSRSAVDEISRLRGLSDPWGNDDEGEQMESSKLNKIISALLGVVLALVVAAVIFIFHINNSGKPETVKMPDVINLDSKLAIKMLADNGLNSTISEYKNSDDIPEGRVISASIDEGTNLKKGYNIKLILSKGSQNKVVPDLLGMDLEKAKDEVINAGFIMGKITPDYSDKEIGQIIEQAPDKDKKLPLGSIIDVKVSKGKKLDKVLVPPLASLTLRKADSTLARLGLKMGSTEYEYSDDFQKGHVISNSLVGKEVDPGTTVNVIVSKGPEQIETETTENTEATTDGTDTTTEESSTAEYREKDLSVSIDINLFESDPSLIRVDFVNNGQKKTVYQAEHYKSEGDSIEIMLHLTGAGSGKLLIYYDSFLKEEMEVDFAQ